MEDKDVEQLESIANFLRGMCLDPRLGAEFKEYITDQVNRIDVITEKYAA